MADAPISEELTALKKRARRRLVGAVALVIIALVVLWTVMDDKPPQGLTNQPVSIVASEPALSSTVLPPSAKPAQPVVTEQPAQLTPPVPVQLSPAVPAAAAPVTPPTPVAPSLPPVVSDPTPAPHPLAEQKPAEQKPLKAPAVVADAKPAAPKPAAHADTPAPKKPDAAPKKPAVDPAQILAGADDSAPAQKHAAKPASDDAPVAHFFVQLGAFADPDKAKALVAKASAAGVTVQDVQVNTDKGQLSRLRAGPFSSRDAAEHALDKLSAAGLSGNVVSK